MLCDCATACKVIEWIGRQINKRSERGRDNSTGWKQKEWRIIVHLVPSPVEQCASTMAFSWYHLCVCVCTRVCFCQVLSGSLTGWAVDCFSRLWHITHSQVHTRIHTAWLWQYNIQGPLSNHPLQCRGKIRKSSRECTQHFVTWKMETARTKHFCLDCSD